MPGTIRKIPNRIVVYPKDVENITGRKERAARKILQKIKLAFGKDRDGFVTVREFSLYTGIDEEVVREYLMM